MCEAAQYFALLWEAASWVAHFVKRVVIGFDLRQARGGFLNAAPLLRRL
jgi:hypothetical protein